MFGLWAGFPCSGADGANRGDAANAAAAAPTDATNSRRVGFIERLSRIEFLQGLRFRRARSKGTVLNPSRHHSRNPDRFKC